MEEFRTVITFTAIQNLVWQVDYCNFPYLRIYPRDVQWAKANDFDQKLPSCARKHTIWLMTKCLTDITYSPKNGTATLQNKKYWETDLHEGTRLKTMLSYIFTFSSVTCYINFCWPSNDLHLNHVISKISHIPHDSLVANTTSACYLSLNKRHQSWLKLYRVMGSPDYLMEVRF